MQLKKSVNNLHVTLNTATASKLPIQTQMEKNSELVSFGLLIETLGPAFLLVQDSCSIFMIIPFMLTINLSCSVCCFSGQLPIIFVDTSVVRDPQSPSSSNDELEVYFIINLAARDEESLIPNMFFAI